MTVLIEVPGVIRTDTGDPIRGVQTAVLALVQNMRVVFCSTAENDELYVKREGFTGYAGYREEPTLEALAKERAQGHVDLVITPDTDTAREVARQGVNVMLCAGSRVVDPRYRPERRSWGQISSEE